VSLETKLCCNCKYLFTDKVKAGEIGCSVKCLNKDPIKFYKIDQVVALPDQSTCDSFSPALTTNGGFKLLVSIISLGTRNDLLKQTILSIKKFNDISADIIVTVDGEEDISELEFMKDIKVFHVKERVGICEALNRSLSEILKEYNYVMFCDDDIRVCSPISMFVNFLREQPMVGIVSGYHDCRMAITDITYFPEYGIGLIKPITSGCHLVMRCNEVKDMMPFKGGGWIYPFIHFDEWVCRKSDKSIMSMSKGIISFPCHIEHTGGGRSTWEGQEGSTREYMEKLNENPVN